MSELRSQPPTSECWEAAKEIVADALELESAAARAAFVAARCQGNDALRQEVESLLEQTTAGLDAWAKQASAPLHRDLSLLAAGRVIGHYAVVRELGRGGMGAVYLAERADGEFEKQVAIKVLKRGTDTDEILHRFRSERRILARFDHPNIAGLLDAGTTDDGLPYFVMEYAEGLPVTQYAREQKLSISERLKLFRVICDAVSEAHRHLVIHRDLKPSNVLVTPKGQVKLLDFGIAKMIQETDEAEQNATLPGARAMTPEYASPEQLKGEPVTTGSDVYSLGVILYELLTGQRPYRVKTRTAEEIARAITTQEPQRPSAVATSIGSRAQKQLRGDLDNIVLKALRLEPQRRYASVEALATDLDRHSQGLPVLAQPDTLPYRVSKFVARHRVAVMAATVALVALLAAMVIVALSERKARVAQKRAEERFQQVRQLAHSLLFDYHDQIASLPGSTNVREHLVREALTYLDNLSREAGTDRALQRELATAYEKIGRIQGNSYYANLGDTAGALQSYRRSLELRLPLLAAQPNDLSLQAEIGQSYEGLGDVLNEMEELPEALKNYLEAVKYEEAVSAAAPQNTDYRLALSSAYSKVGDIEGMEGYDNLGRTADALHYYQKAVALIEPLAANERAERPLLSRLAMLLSHRGRLEDVSGDNAAALASGRRAVAILEKLVASDPNQAAHRRTLLAARAFLRFTLLDANLIVESAELSRAVVADLEAMVKADPGNANTRRNLAIAYNSLGQDLLKTGDVNAAIANHQRALEFCRQRLAANPASASAKADLSFTLRWLGEAQAASGNPAAALLSFDESLQLRTADQPGKTPNERARSEIAQTLVDKAENEAKRGHFVAAEASFHKALSVAEELSARSPTNARLQAYLAHDYFAAGKVAAEIAQKSGPESLQARNDAVLDFQKSLRLWEELQRRHALYPADANQPEKVRQALSLL